MYSGKNNTHVYNVHVHVSKTLSPSAFLNYIHVVSEFLQLRTNLKTTPCVVCLQCYGEYKIMDLNV